MSARDEHLATAMTAARGREPHTYVFMIELYCDRDGCAARTITIHIKELDGPIPACLPRCPLCRSPLKTHGVQTLQEAAEEDKRDARASVNAQLYLARERRLGREPFAVPLGVFLDDRLPGASENEGHGT